MAVTRAQVQAWDDLAFKAPPGPWAQARVDGQDAKGLLILRTAPGAPIAGVETTYPVIGAALDASAAPLLAASREAVPEMASMLREVMTLLGQLGEGNVLPRGWNWHRGVLLAKWNEAKSENG